MLNRRMLDKGTFAALLMVALTGGIACGDASAMARGHSGSGDAPALPAPVDPVPGSVAIAPSAGDFSNGYDLGLRNGQILVERLRQRTTDLAGCGAVDQLQDALIAVTRTIRPPLNSGDAVVSGFYSGYLDAVRGELDAVRTGCNDLAYGSGAFPGTLYGTVVCQVSTVDANAVAGLQLQPLYVGWSGGSSEVLKGCRTVLKSTIQSCANAADTSGLDATAELICSDSSSH